MIRYACGMAVAIYLLTDASYGWSQQQYLYSPAAVSAEGVAHAKDGVLVQEVSVQKGDTLYGISRRFSGHGSYYPQILLFNDIKDPNRIYPGNVFRVPVSRNTISGQADKESVKREMSMDGSPAHKQLSAVQPAAPVTGIPVQELKKVDGVREKKRGAREKVVGVAKKQVASEKQHAAAVSSGDATAGQKLFERAVKAYRQDDCRAALELFDRFLAENQASALAADASLYKAECYLKLSGQK